MVIQVDARVVDQNIDRVFDLAIERLDAGRIGKVERVILDLLPFACLEAKVVPGARCGVQAELLGSQIRMGENRVAYGPPDAAVLALARDENATYGSCHDHGELAGHGL